MYFLRSEPIMLTIQARMSGTVSTLTKLVPMMTARFFMPRRK